MGRNESLQLPRLLYVNPLDIGVNSDAPQWIADATGFSSDHITTINIANGDILPKPTELPGRYAGIVGGGGKHSVNESNLWINNYNAWLKELENTEVPLFGICFSHQALAKTKGGTVENVGNYRYGVEMLTLTKEGKADPLFDGIPENFSAFVINGQYVTRLPPDAVELAHSHKHRNEALTYGAQLKTVQLHPERTRAVMRRVARIRSEDQTRPPDMRAAYRNFLGDHSPLGSQAEINGLRIVKNWVDHVVNPYHRERVADSQRSGTIYQRPIAVV